MRLLTTLLVIVLTSCVEAQECKIVVDVTECRNGFCVPAQWMGNGVYVAVNRDRTSSLVLTVAHNVTPTQGVTIRSVTVDGVPATVLRAAQRGDFDLAVLRVHRSGSKPIAVGADDPPAVGDKVYVRGWIDQHARFTSSWGNVTAPGRATYDSRQGVSGSPVYNAGGELLGVHVGMVGTERRYQSVLPLDALVASADVSMLTASQMQPTAPYRRPPPNEQTPPPPAEPLPAVTEPVGPATAPQAPTRAGSTATAAADVPADATAEKPSGLARVAADVKSAAPGVVADVAAAAADAAPAGPMGLMELVAIAGGTGGTGAAAVLGAKFAYGLWQRRRKRKLESSQQSAPTTVQVPVAQPVPQPVAPVIDPRIDAVLDYLRDREQTVASDADLIEKAKGIVLRQTIAADGSTEESWWKEGVRLAAAGSPIINVLGGRQVGKAIEDYVARRHAEAAGDTLRS
jgi:hypothetical protein